MDFFRKKRPLPSFWETYHRDLRAPYSRKTPIQDVRFVVFDTETTGLHPKKDKILSIGAVSVRANQIDLRDSFECFLRQDAQARQETIAVHGILPGKSQQGTPEAQALEDFVAFAGKSVLVGQHLAFDLAILNQGLKRHWDQKLKNAWIDTQQLAIRLEHLSAPAHLNRSNYALDALCERYGIPASDRHTASGDALITALLFLKLLNRLKKRGVVTLGQLLKGKG